jgi:hypothetical protein
MHHDVVGTDVLGMFRKFDYNVHVLVRARHDRAGSPCRGVDGQLEGAFALRQRHREELALFPGDEDTVDTKILDPMSKVALKSGFIDGEVGRKWR